MKLRYGFVVLLPVVFAFCAKVAKAADSPDGTAATEVVVTRSFENEEAVQSPENKKIIDNTMIRDYPLVDVLLNVWWTYAGGGGERLQFQRDLSWTLTDFHGLGAFVKGTYVIIDDSTVLLDLTNIEYNPRIGNNPNAKEIVQYALGGGPQVPFVLQRDYTDFYSAGRLYNEQFKKTFRSNIPSPVNERYELDGVIVTKKGGSIMVEEVLLAKKIPFGDAEDADTDFRYRLSKFSSFAGHPKEGKKYNVFLPGEVFEYNAMYGGGGNHPWYRIKVSGGEYYEDAWIYGSSVKDMTDRDNGGDYEKTMQALVEMGYIDMASIER